MTIIYLEDERKKDQERSQAKTRQYERKHRVTQWEKREKGKE
jgi:hypothetical protein